MVARQRVMLIPALLVGSLLVPAVAGAIGSGSTTGGGCTFSYYSIKTGGNIVASTSDASSGNNCTTFGARARDGSTFTTWDYRAVDAVRVIADTSATPDGGQHQGRRTSWSAVVSS